MPGERQQPRKTIQSVMNDIIGRINTDTRRLRVIEQEAEILKSRMAALEQNSGEQKKAANSSFSELRNKVIRAEEKVARMESLVQELAKGLKRFAPASEIRRLEQLIEIYSPLKSEFLTKEEAERIVEEKVDRIKSSL
jgi:hypothetical protein